jgi:hypothetical protein
MRNTIKHPLVVIFIVFLLIFNIPASLAISSIIPQDEELNTYKLTVLKAAQNWYPTPKDKTSIVPFNSVKKAKEMDDFALSTWNGCQGETAIVDAYTEIAIKESQLIFLSNDLGCGYSGGMWPTIITELEKRGMPRPAMGWRLWCVRHKYKVNLLLAQHFYSLCKYTSVKSATKTWLAGYTWRNYKIRSTWKYGDSRSKRYANPAEQAYDYAIDIEHISIKYCAIKQKVNFYSRAVCTRLLTQ